MFSYKQEQPMKMLFTKFYYHVQLQTVKEDLERIRQVFCDEIEISLKYLFQLKQI